MTKLAEGKVGFAKGQETLNYPAVTSCLTVTCVTADGGKWGAHLSQFQCGDGLPHKVILQTLRTEMSTAKAIPQVRKVLVVGALNYWPSNLKPGTNQISIPGHESETSGILKERLGLKTLDANSREHFVFKNSDQGDVNISSGSAATAIKLA